IRARLSAAFGGAAPPQQRNRDFGNRFWRGIFEPGTFQRALSRALRYDPTGLSGERTRSRGGAGKGSDMNVAQAIEKPRQTFAGLMNISFGFFGIQVGFALQSANMSRIFQSLGASLDQLPVLWIAAPLTGLLVQPIVGHLSDRTWLGRLGRRRPYFLAGALLAALSLFLMPLSQVLLMAAVLLWALDASLNITMEPFRAFVGDMLRKDQRSEERRVGKEGRCRGGVGEKRN